MVTILMEIMVLTTDMDTTAEVEVMVASTMLLQEEQIWIPTIMQVWDLLEILIQERSGQHQLGLLAPKIVKEAQSEGFLHHEMKAGQ